jgi:hypothetical protein
MMHRKLYIARAKRFVLLRNCYAVSRRNSFNETTLCGHRARVKHDALRMVLD